MNLNDRVRIIGLDVKTDHPPVGVVTKLYFRFRGTTLEQKMAEVTFDKNLFDEGNRLEGAIHEHPEGVPKLSVEISRVELIDS
jgi:hypothetical protein